MQIIALPFPQLPYGIVERGPQRKEREVEKKKKGEEKWNYHQMKLIYFYHWG